MIQLICFVKRRAGMSREAFSEHWLKRHGPLIADRPDFARHILRYEQNHRLASDYAREGGGGFDGVTIQQMESRSSFIGFATEPAYADVIHVDELRFLDLSGLAFMLAEAPHAVIDGPGRAACPVKLIALLRRRPDLSAEAFHEHWRNVHGPLFRDTQELARHMLGYDQHVRLPRDYERDQGRGWDGCSEVFFESLDQFEALAAEPAFKELIPTDEARFLERSAITYVLTDPAHVIMA